MLNMPIPTGVNSPPKIGEYCYFHSNVKDEEVFLYEQSHYICNIKRDDNEIVQVAVHYSKPDKTGSAPFITYQGKLVEIIKTIN